MVFSTKQMTVEEFDQFVDLSINANKLFEYVGGEVTEVPSNPYSSKIAAIFLVELGIYLKGNDIGHITGEAGGYIVSGERYAPDVAFISYEKQENLARTGYNPNPPDLAVEVVSPTDSEKKLSIKISNYLADQTTVVVIYPDEKQVAIHQHGQPVILLGSDDILFVDSILPDFQVSVADLFPQE